MMCHCFGAGSSGRRIVAIGPNSVCPPHSLPSAPDNISKIEMIQIIKKVQTTVEVPTHWLGGIDMSNATNNFQYQ